MFQNFIKCTSLMTAMSIAAIVHAQTPTPAPSPPAPRAKGPSLELAVEAAQIAVATCTANGYKTTILITDSAGVPVVLFSGNGVSERTQTIAASKIAAALRYNMSSGEVANKARTDAALAEEIKADPKIGTPRQGALLLKVGNDTIGAIAVSGAPGGDKDEVCAQAAIDKIKDRLR